VTTDRTNATAGSAGIPVVTISASYGAGGSVVGPEVAELIGAPFLDRAIPTAVAERLAVPLEEVLAHHHPPTGLGRLIAAFAHVSSLSGADVSLPPHGIVREQRFREQHEEVLKQMARSTGGVILGHAGAVVLQSFPGALHVRLDGPPEARARRVMQRENLDERIVGRRLRENDRAREAYVRYFYRANPGDPKLYHLVLDGTALPLETCVELIVRATRARQEQTSSR
jgi:cytidylate kinase